MLLCVVRSCKVLFHKADRYHPAAKTLLHISSIDKWRPVAGAENNGVRALKTRLVS